MLYMPHGSYLRFAIMDFASCHACLCLDPNLTCRLPTPPSSPPPQTVIFVDDINMPALEQFGAQPPIELVRQVLSQGGFYDLKKLFFKRVQNTSFIAACGPPGGGRNAITPRLVRHFSLIWIPELSESAMRDIFVSILSGFLTYKQFIPAVAELGKPIVRSTVELYNLMRREMLPTPSKSHYTFNLRDVSRVVQGILQVTPAKCADDGTFLRLWAHECSRVFCDRLTNHEDRRWFGSQLATVLENEPYVKPMSADAIKGIVWGMYMNTSGGVANALYEELDLKKSSAKFDEYLADFNINTTKP